MNEPVSSVHPTIYIVRLGLGHGVVWEASVNYRKHMTAKWIEKARALGKTTVEVHGRYCKYASFDVPPEEKVNNEA